MTYKDRSKPDDFLEELFETYRLPILNYLYRLVGDAAQAEELAQDVFVRACSALDRLPYDANFRAWLYRIATNIAIDRLRRRRLLQWLPLQEFDGSRRAQEVRKLDVEDEVLAQQKVRSALAQVPPGHRAALILFSVEGYSVREIAKVLGISEGAVKTRLFRAREAFRRAYGEDE